APVTAEIDAGLRVAEVAVRMGARTAFELTFSVGRHRSSWGNPAGERVLRSWDPAGARQRWRRPGAGRRDRDRTGTVAVCFGPHPDPAGVRRRPERAHGPRRSRPRVPG